MDEEITYQKWLDFLSLHADEIQGLIDISEKDVHFTVTYQDILQRDEKLAEDLLDHPKLSLEIISTVLERFRAPDQPQKRLNLHVKTLPPVYHRAVKDIGDRDLNHLRSTEAMVIRRKARVSKIITAVFECQSCGHTQTLEQDLKKFIEPLECPKPEGGCGKRKGMTFFNIRDDLSIREDYQWIYIQDDYRQDRHSRPERIPVLLKEPLVQKVEVGQKVIITHWPALKQVGKDENEFTFYLVANHISPADPGLDLALTEADLENFREIAPHILTLGMRSVAPQLMGYDPIKLSLFLQFIGAPDSVRNCGVTERGAFHILLFGEGGTGKSQLIQDALKLWPVGYFSGAKNVTSAGLTYAVVKDEVMGGWVLEAGVLILADGNLACIDELDKADPEQIGSLHMVMENQRITINKAGINADIPTHPTILAVANPKSGKIIPTFRIDEQSPLGRTLLQRFGLKWILINPDDQGFHERRMMHSLRSQDQNSDIGKRVLDIRTLQKYRAYAQTFDPVLTPDIQGYITRKYGELIRIGWNRETSDITQRVGEDLIRISRAVARAQLRDKVQASDVDLALWLISRSLDPVINGTNDIMPETLTGQDPANITTPEELLNIIERLDRERKGVKVPDLVDYCSAHALTGVDETLKNLFERGLIFYPRSNRIQTTGG